MAYLELDEVEISIIVSALYQANKNIEATAPPETKRLAAFKSAMRRRNRLILKLEKEV